MPTNPKRFADRIAREPDTDTFPGFESMFDPFARFEHAFDPFMKFKKAFNQMNDEAEKEEELQVTDVGVSEQEQPTSKNQKGNVTKPPSNGGAKTFYVEIRQGMTTKEGFLRYAEQQIFGRIVNIKWKIEDVGLNQTISNPAKNVGKEIKFQISAQTLEKYRSSNSEKTKESKETEYTSLPESDQHGITSEIDRRYYEKLNIEPGTPIGANDTTGKKVWNDTRDEVLLDKEKIDRLSAATKDFIKLPAKVDPADYEKILEIVKLLKKFNATDMLDYQGVVNRETTNLDDMIASLQGYLENKREEQKDTAINDRIETKLYGLEELYKKFKAYKSNAHTSSGTSSAGIPVNTYTSNDTALKEKREKQELIRLLNENGFSSIDQFSRYILAYQKSFEQQTLHVAEHHLRKYRAFLHIEKKKVEDNKVEANSKNYLTNLLQKIKGSGAKANYEAANNNFRSSTGALGSRSGGNDFATKENASASLKLHEEAATQLAIADEKIKGLSPITELISEDQFDKEGFATVQTESELRAFLIEYIEKKEESIETTWKDLHANPEGIYELNELLAESKTTQQIEEGSIFDLIIKDKMTELGNDQLLETICTFVIAIALIILNIATLGASTPVTLSVLSLTLGFSAFSVFEAIEEYDKQDTANDVGFLTGDPSYVWVLIAILGAVADVASFTRVLKSAVEIKEAVDLIDDAGSLVAFENKLMKIDGLEQKVKDSIKNQARLRARKAAIATELSSRLGSFPDPILMFEYMGLSVKNGAAKFSDFIIDLKAAKLIKETGFSTEELGDLNEWKDLFKKLKSLSKDETQMAEFNRLVKEKDLDGLRKLLNSSTQAKVLPKNLSVSRKKDLFQAIDTNISEDALIGFASVDNEGYVTFAIYTEDLGTNIRGSEVMEGLLNEMNSSGVKFQGFRGIWNVESSNTETFNLLLTQGLSREEAAWGTFTGKMSKKYGYNHVTIDVCEPRIGPPFTKIHVKFDNK